MKRLRTLTLFKGGEDFAYSTNQSPIVGGNSKTAAFHAFFDSSIAEDGHRYLILKRVVAFAPILPSDLLDFRFDFGMAVGVGGEVLREKLEQMIEFYDDPWTIRKMREKGMVREVKQRERC
ncbi:unnamed protein product [Citrullus colocynthis]|uniref:Uncharacterized protein n=1 Tax=Citrullus colocynthis TaxID=252529 RepID=A0ABP0XYI6_9ROSI